MNLLFPITILMFIGICMGATGAEIDPASRTARRSIQILPHRPCIVDQKVDGSSRLAISAATRFISAKRVRFGGVGDSRIRPSQRACWP
jgi:hypothetical protein